MLVLLALTLAACGRFGSSPDETDASSAHPTDVAGGSPAPGGGAKAPAGIPNAVWTAVLADLEPRVGGPADPEVISAEPMTWSDGALGCPEPGKSYTQALVDGYQLVLEVNGERYDYRVGSGTTVKLCDGGPLEGGG